MPTTHAPFPAPAKATSIGRRSLLRGTTLAPGSASSHSEDTHVRAIEAAHEQLVLGGNTLRLLGQG